VEEVVNMHRAQIVTFGGLHGIRDIGLLGSAINTPQASFGGVFLHADIPSQAAAYLYHIVKNHPFLDENKRTGALSTIVFLKTNDMITPWSNDALSEKTESVLNTDKDDQATRTGIIKAIGSKVDRSFEVGKRALFNKYAGACYKDNIFLMKQNEILALIEE
jgi:death on curing protein